MAEDKNNNLTQDELEQALDAEMKRQLEKKAKRDARIPAGMTPEEYRARRRKDMIKNFAIAFLAIMLLLTLFSNTIMNITLPQVTTAQVAAGDISPQIRGTGTLTAGKVYEVTISQTRTIQSVDVKVGDVVEKDQILYHLEDAESSELADARSAAEDARNAYELGMFDGNIPAEDVLSIKSGSNLSLDKFISELNKVNDDYRTALKNDIDVQAQIDEYTYYQELCKLYVTADSDRDSSTAAATTMSDADIQYQQKLLDQKIKNLDEEISEYDSVISALGGNPSYPEEVPDFGEDVDKYNAYQNAVNNKYVAESQKGVATREKEKLANFGDLEARNAGYWDGLITGAKENKNRTASALATAEKSRTDCLAKITSELKLVQLRTAYEELTEKVEKLEETAIGATIKAPVAGTVTNLAYKSGEKTEANKEVASIQLDGQALTVSFSVTNAQAMKAKVGQAAQPKDAWAYSEFSATLTSITNDQTDPAGHKVLNFDVVSPDAQAGQSITLVMGEAAVAYDLIVPNSAVREDKNGKFILAVISKPSPFGNRYIASRVDVQVQAKDDKNSAITGAVEAYSYVIVTSTAAVKNGEQVRLADSDM